MVPIDETAICQECIKLTGGKCWRHSVLATLETYPTPYKVCQECMKMTGGKCWRHSATIMGSTGIPGPAPERMPSQCDKCGAECARLRAELEKANEALKVLSAVLGRIATCQSYHPDDIVGLARKALASTPTPAPPKLTKEEAIAIIDRMRADPDLDAMLQLTFAPPRPGEDPVLMSVAVKPAPLAGQCVDCGNSMHDCPTCRKPGAT